MDQAEFDKQARLTLLGRGTSPKEISDAAKFILSQPALTGQMIALDGGQHLVWQTPMWCVEVNEMTKKPMISHHVASAAARLRHVFVRDLEILSPIGIYEQEKLKPQRIIVNIDLSVQEGSGDDDISHVVSYEIVVKKVEAIIAEGHTNLVETLCEKIAASLPERQPRHGRTGARRKTRHHPQCAQCWRGD